VRKAIDNANHPALLYVDGVSSVGSLEFRMDEWGVDLAITGSQKGFMLPAGLGLIAASQKALARRESAKLPRVFFDFGDQIKANATGYFPYTPAKRGSTTSTRATIAWPRASAPRSRRGGSRCVRRTRNGIPTRCPRS
jgi:aspartate aminotransferase-like enzyme